MQQEGLQAGVLADVQVGGFQAGVQAGGRLGELFSISLCIGGEGRGGGGGGGLREAGSIPIVRSLSRQGWGGFDFVLLGVSTRLVAPGDLGFASTIGLDFGAPGAGCR